MPSSAARAAVHTKASVTKMTDGEAASAIQPLTAPHTLYSLDPSRTFERNVLWSVAVFHLLDEAAAAAVIALAEAHADTHGWSRKRHAHYPTTDIAIEPKGAPSLHQALQPLVDETILPLLAAHFGFTTAECRVHDLFLIKYECGTDNQQDRLLPHRDGNLLSFSVLLSKPADFSGGGLRFHSLGPLCDAVGCSAAAAAAAAASAQSGSSGSSGGSVGGRTHCCRRCDNVGRLAIPCVRCGDLTIHCGKLLHEAMPVTSGRRFVVVGFVSVVAPGRVDSEFVECSTHANTSTVGAWADYEILEECLVEGSGSQEQERM